MILVYHLKGALCVRCMIGINIGEVENSSRMIGRSVEGGDGTFGFGILIWTIAGIKDEGVVAFGADAVKFPALAFVAMGLIGFPFCA